MSLSKFVPIRYCKETRNRIRLSLAAHMYEKHNDSFMSDSEYDSLSLKIDVTKRAGNRKMDKFFRDHFTPDSGIWIHKHPERDKLEQICQRLFLKG